MYTQLQKDLKTYALVGADKNLGCVIIPRKEYERLCTQALEEGGSYVRTAFTEEAILRFYSHRLRIACPELYGLLQPTSSQRKVANIDGLVKIHKKPIKIRPVQSAGSTYFTKLSLFLNGVFQPIMARVKRDVGIIVENSVEVVNALLPLRDITMSQTKSHDFVSLYPNINQTLCLSHMMDFLQHYRPEPAIRLRMEWDEWDTVAQRKRTIVQNVYRPVVSNATIALLLKVLAALQLRYI